MGVKIGDLVYGHKIDLSLLSGKTIAVDAYNAMYQFLSTIRRADGTPLMTSRGEVTSVHSGIFYRTAKLVKGGITPVYVFDGEPPSFKRKTVEKRAELRREAREKWHEALAAGRVEEARKYAQAALSLTPDMVEDGKRILEHMGLPIVQAPSEGEAQAAHMAERGDVWAAGSQDYDMLLFGAPRLVRNLSFSGKRKLPGKQAYVRIWPERVDLEETLKSNGMEMEQLIMVGILVGTDYNPGGVKGIGCKKALRLVLEHKTPEKLFSSVKWDFKTDPMDIYSFFLDPPVTTEYEVTTRAPNRDALFDFMVGEHEFSASRVEKVMDQPEYASRKGKGLETWL